MASANHGYILTEKKSSWNLLNTLGFWTLLKNKLFTFTTYMNMANETISCD